MTDAEHRTREEVMRNEFVEKYIRSLTWSDDVSEHVKALVAGNIRAFAAHLHKVGALQLRNSDLRD